MTRVSGPSSQSTITDPNALSGGGPVNDPNKSSGTGGINSTGGPLPAAGPSYAPPPPPPQLSDADLALLSKALELSGLVSGDSGFDYDSVISALGSLMIDQAGHQRSQAMQQRSTSAAAAQSSQLQQASEQLDAANKMDSGAMKSMVIGCVTAAVSIVTSGMSLGAQIGSVKKTAQAAGEVKLAESGLEKATAKASKFTDAGTVPTTEVQKGLKDAQDAMSAASGRMRGIDDTLKRYQTGADIGGRVGDMGRQIGTGLDTRDQASAKRDEAEGSINAAEATVHQQKAEMAKEIQQALDDMIKQIINFVKEMQENEVEMMRAITR